MTLRARNDAALLAMLAAALVTADHPAIAQQAPALTPLSFAEGWNGKEITGFHGKVHETMPWVEPAALAAAADGAGFILAQNGSSPAKPPAKAEPDAPIDVPPKSGSGVAAQRQAPRVMIGALAGPVTQPTTRGPTQAELDGADNATDSWLMYNKGYRNERYSSLDAINVENAAKLHPVCMFKLGEIGTFSTGPVVYDGLLYVTTHLSTYAIDATTCAKLWTNTYRPQGKEIGASNKGVAIAGGRVIRGSQDGSLFALDAKTGDVLWNGRSPTGASARGSARRRSSGTISSMSGNRAATWASAAP